MEDYGSKINYSLVVKKYQPKKKVVIVSDILSLPPNTESSIYQKFVSIKEIPNIVQVEIAAWGDWTGGGFQYELPYNIKKLKELGYMREIN